MDINSLIVTGRLAVDPEQRFTPKGAACTKLTVIVNRAWTDASGELRKEHFGLKVIVWGKSGEACFKHLVKGREVMVEGRLNIRQGTGEYAESYFTECIANQVKFGAKPNGKATEAEEHIAEPEEIPF